ncbi:hypothetical protein PINS_up011389 [Pythium insidiosum]|nr:hypothetical protein PINS_up011389 [Pythium insidiosum]
MLFIKDDLCGAVLRYCRLGASTEMKIPILCLSIIRTLWTKLRALLKMQFEAIFNGIFCHSLHWTISHMDLGNPIFQHGDGFTQQGTEAKSFKSVEVVREEFSGEMVTLNKLFAVSFEILECLVDLLAESSILPDLYVNYDCDGNRSDVTQTIFDLLAQVVSGSHRACQETTDEAHFLWAQAMGEQALAAMFNSTFVLYMRSQHAAIGGELFQSNGDLPNSDGGFSAQALYLMRERKKFFQHGIQEFNRKPLSGIKYLQQHGFLPDPLDPKSLAVFLRSLPPGLSKAAVGVYLGAMGKEVKDFEKSEIHVADTMEFHREVLKRFVCSFTFEGESIVAALRMFLASFRLPGEAQQIDRILNTFSIQVYEQCRERFLMASADVAYLLSFSLIMLNTDLHNPNIRPEKKMKLEDFIKNNKNYGAEVSMNQDLPEEFLTELYEAIAKEEIKTREDDSKHGEVTTDRWKDLLYQAEGDPQNSRLIVHQSLREEGHTNVKLTSSPTAQRSPRRHSQPNMSGRRSKKKARRRKSSSAVLQNDRPCDERAQSTEEEGDDPRGFDSFLFNGDESSGKQYDQHIFALIRKQLLSGFSSVFEQYVEASRIAQTSAEGMETRIQEPLYVPEKGMLQLACNGIVLCAAVAARHSFSSEFNDMFEVIARYSAMYPSPTYPLAYNQRHNGAEFFCNNQSAPVATAALLKLVATCGESMTAGSWASFFYVLCALRDLQALPEKVIYGSFGSTDSLLTDDECSNFMDLVQVNKEELERREALRLQAANGGTSTTGSFFSGVAWLMSAFDHGSTSNPSSLSLSRDLNGQNASPTQAKSSGAIVDPVGYFPSPLDMAMDASDLIVKTKPDTPFSDEDPAKANSEWIRNFLLPYRLEHLVDEISGKTPQTLAVVFHAVDEEIRTVLTEPLDCSDDMSSESVSTPQRRQSKPATSENSRNAISAQGRRLLSPAGCVFFEHMISRLISAISKEKLLDEAHGVMNLLEAHFNAVLDLVRPILTENKEVNGIGYTNAAFVLEKSLEGAISMALKARSKQATQVLLTLLTNLVDLSADDELIKPYLTTIMCGLKRIVDSIDLRSVSLDRSEWSTLSTLIGWAADSQDASVHAFALLEKLIASEVWKAVGDSISLMELYTKALVFALEADSQLKWPRQRPIELLTVLFEHTVDGDPSILEEQHLRQLGGMVIVCRRNLSPGLDAAGPLSNELALGALDGLKRMVHSKSCKGNLTGGAWLDVLDSGLIPLGLDLLQGRTRMRHSQRRQSVDSNEPQKPFMFYQRNLPPSLLSGRGLDAQELGGKQPSRRRRPSVVKDQHALRPHVLVVEMLSWVVCEQLDQLLLLNRFASIWDDLVDLLLGFLEATRMDQREANNTEMLLALERRSVLSAHEEMIENVKSIIRRLQVLQHEFERTRATSGDEDETTNGALASARFHALMHVIVDKSKAKGDEYHGLLFPSTEDASSAGELTPPAAVELLGEETEAELSE